MRQSAQRRRIVPVSRRGKRIAGKNAAFFVVTFASGSVLSGMTWSAAHSEVPLTLERAVSLALSQSSQGKVLLRDREVKQIGLNREKPTARPTVDAKLSGTLQGPEVFFPRPNGTRGVFLPEQFVRLELNIEQILYRPGLGAARERFAAQQIAADEELRKSQSELVLEVSRAYFNLLKAEAGVQTAQSGMEFSLRYKTLVQEQIRAGVAKPVDTETAEAQFAEAQTGQIRAQNGLRLAQMNLNRLLGQPLQTPVLLTSEAQETSASVVSSSVAVALETRPELRLLEANLKVTKAGISLAKTQAQPSLWVRGQAAEQTPTALLPQTYYGATLEIRFPLFDGGKARSDTAEAKAQLEKLKALREETASGIELEVTEAFLGIEEARAKRHEARARLKSAEANLRVSETAYGVGHGTLLEVQNAQRERQAAQSAVLSAETDLRLAAALLKHAEGADLPARTGKKPE